MDIGTKIRDTGEPCRDEQAHEGTTGHGQANTTKTELTASSSSPDLSPYLACLAESTDAVRSRDRLVRSILIVAYSLVWAIALVAFWAFGAASDAMGYSIMFLGLLLPVTTFVVSLVIGKRDYWGRWKWAVAPVLGATYMLAGYSTFSLANMLTFDKLNVPDIGAILIGTAVSLAGIGIGSVVRLALRHQPRYATWTGLACMGAIACLAISYAPVSDTLERWSASLEQAQAPAYSRVLQANWGVALPAEALLTEEHEQDSGASFHGDGIRYHVYSYADADPIRTMLLWVHADKAAEKTGEQARHRMWPKTSRRGWTRSECLPKSAPTMVGALTTEIRRPTAASLSCYGTRELRCSMLLSRSCSLGRKGDAEGLSGERPPQQRRPIHPRHPYPFSA